MKIRNLIRCNTCEARSCKLYDEIDDSSKCYSFIEAQEFKLPIVVHLLSDSQKSVNTSRVLSRFKIRVKEINKYPYIITYYKKKKRRK